MTDPRPLAIVTGASSGIGAAIARRLSELGHPLLVTARRRDRLEQLGLPRTTIAGVDVTDTAAMAAAIRAAEEEHGPADLLVNNAGLMPLGRVADQDPAEWRAMFEVNVLALLEVTRLVLPAMIARRHGTIVNIGSVAGRNVYDDHTVYNGTKFAVHAMSEGLRREVASSGVRVTVVAPGQVATELLEHTTSAEIRDGYRAYTASIGGAMDPRHVAEVVAQAYALPQEVCIRELVLAPTAQDA
jgi:NADP-dependent 3-hydroxy acid dehydrogenase YdfG